MRNFEVTIADSDGEEHSYTFVAATTWDITHYIAREMHIKGDFYGHKRADTTELSVVELIEDADTSAAIRI